MSLHCGISQQEQSPGLPNHWFSFCPYLVECICVYKCVCICVCTWICVCLNLLESLWVSHLRNWKHELNIFQSALSCVSIFWSVFTMRQDFNSLLCSARPLKSSWLWRASLLRQETQYRWRYIKSLPVCSVSNLCWIPQIGTCASINVYITPKHSGSHFIPAKRNYLGV